MDRIDRSWANELAADKVKVSLDDGARSEIELMLVKDFMMNKAEARDCADTINGCAGESGAHIKAVIVETLPGNMKPSFKNKAAERILDIVIKALDKKETPTAPAPATPKSQAPAAKNDITPKIS